MADVLGRHDAGRALLGDAHIPWLTAIVVLLCIGAWPAWVLRRDWPYRWHWLPLLFAAMGTAWSMSLMPSYSVALRHQGPWALAVGLSLAVAGLGDHLLLVRTLHGRPARDAATSEETP
jgi:hypothetical protein